ncbi:MAG TPA: ABC transporter substrate-binding protein [Stellaceae bacterium]|jgi:putative ABC transport system substrate-binding protein|nr:ABC transporter substrate-binding protein [Stellaceae bacterium]
MIGRRSILLGMTAAAAVPLSAVAQSGKIYRIGLLSPTFPFTDKNPMVVGLTKAFTKRGYAVGTNLVFEGRAAQGKIELLPQLVDELNAADIDVLITLGYPPAAVAKERSKAPVVVTSSGDPIATHLVASLARPGGNITGVSEIAAELSGKRLQLLKETVPSIRKVAMLWNADDLGMTLRYEAADKAAKQLDLTVQSLGVRAPDDFGTAFTAMDKEPPDGLLMVTDALTNLNHKRVFDYAAVHKLPAIYEYDFLVRDGGLMSYGPNGAEVLDRAAGLADRILKGAKPADLPLEEPTKFDLLVNQKTADAIGLTIPQSILARADEVLD